MVLLGPQCPALQTGHQCPDKPIEAEIRVRRWSGVSNPKESLGGVGKVLATARSGDDGRFEIALSPGNYTLEASAQSAMSCAAVDVTVPADHYAKVTIFCNTGIG